LLDTRAGRIAVDAQRLTSLPDVWASGGCVAGGQHRTAVAVEYGKRAALSIDQSLRAVRTTEANHG